jgi:hypothetical protein
VTKEEQILAIQRDLPVGSIVLYDRLTDMTTIVVNSGPWYPKKDLDLYAYAKSLEREQYRTRAEREGGGR